ncbi:hypothetical protein [Agromyces archimandritae]|uniref:Amino acid-binding ACT domain-containing protein n=1 Tax=Agromyces archimandritae TaxID=2781962 RepID=A0A975FLY4_9MICO|nr:hypothetical protein [Agromyces archimandritae]QTX04332.1 hypothetical protein G127AT_13790 [Agromyces archimandritae]
MNVPFEADIEVRLTPSADALAAFARTTAAAGVSLEGGGAWVEDARGIHPRLVAHFLVADGEAAARALRAAGLDPVVRHVATTRLDQETPGTLAAHLAKLAEAGVPLIAQYSDHGGRLVIVTDAEHLAAARACG